MRKFSFVMLIVLVFSLTLTGCGGGSSGGGNPTHTHASDDGLEPRIVNYLNNIGTSKVDDILSFLDSNPGNSFILQFCDENGNVIRTKDYKTFEKDLKAGYKLNIVTTDANITPNTSYYNDKPDNFDGREYIVIIEFSESPENGQLKNGLLTITMRNYNNQNDWLCNKIMIWPSKEQ